MRIDRERAAAAFAAYTSAYGTDNPRITLKVEHTLRTAGFAEEIARAEGLSPDDVDLAWLLGLLHDIGRFEQVRRYDSFLDAATVSHAALGVEVLFSPAPSEGPADGGIRRFVEDDAEDGLIRLAVGCHSALRLPEGLDARQRTFCEILRDADKIDILKVNRINTCEDSRLPRACGSWRARATCGRSWGAPSTTRTPRSASGPWRRTSGSGSRRRSRPLRRRPLPCRSGRAANLRLG